jgi:excisionase family DNA binding protein
VVRVTHGANDSFFPVVGKSVAAVRKGLATAFSIPTDAEAYINGSVVDPGYRLQAGDSVEFLRRWGRKGVGSQVWTEEQFCKFFQITPDTLHAWIGQGLQAKPCLDGSLRITETAADEFFRADQVQSPYLTAEQAARYLGLGSVKSLYGLVERRKLTPLPGHRTYRFTTEQLDAYLRGGGNG